MAKFGPKDQGEYDPFGENKSDAFSKISSAVAELATEAPSRPPEKSKTLNYRDEHRTDQETDQRRDRESGRGRAVEEEAPKTPKVPTAVALKTTKRFLTTRDESVQLDSAIARFGARIGIPVDFSKVTRALWEVYLRHEEDILRNVPSGESWIRPANNDAAGLAEMEGRLSTLIEEGLLVASMRPRNRR